MAEAITVVGGGVIGLVTAFELTAYCRGAVSAGCAFPAHGCQCGCVPFTHAQAFCGDGRAHRLRYDRHVGGGG